MPIAGPASAANARGLVQTALSKGCRLSGPHQWILFHRKGGRYSGIIGALARLAVGFWSVVTLALSVHLRPPVERLTATAFSRANSQVRTAVEIDIDRWSDQSENDQVAGAFRRSGVEAALRELANHPPMGQVRSSSGLSRTIRYARESNFTNGSRYLLVLVDPFTSDDFFQGTNSPSGDLAAIAIWLGKSGEGEGQIAAGSRIGIDAFGAVTVDVRDPMIVFPHIGRQG